MRISPLGFRDEVNLGEVIKLHLKSPEDQEGGRERM